MAYKIPYTFIPGTKAKANEVNSNFSKVADYFTELNASLIENTTSLESVGTDLETTKKLFKEGRTKFCVNSSDGTLITTAENNVYFNSSFIITNSKGITATISSVQPINCQSFANGTHNIFVGLDSISENFANSIYKQKTEPTTKNLNDIWLNTSQEPIFAGKWNGSIWEEYLKVPVGNVVIANNAITTTSIFPYNQNGYNINQLSPAITELSALNQTGKSTIRNLAIPNYNQGVIKVWNTLYTADTDGFIKHRARINGAGGLYGMPNSNCSVCYINGAIYDCYYTNGSYSDVAIEKYTQVAKGDTYKLCGGYNSFVDLMFYPAKGAN